MHNEQLSFLHLFHISNYIDTFLFKDNPANIFYQLSYDTSSVKESANKDSMDKHFNMVKTTAFEIRAQVNIFPDLYMYFLNEKKGDLINFCVSNEVELSMK